MVSLSPFVFWAQTETNLSLRVDLKNAENPNLEVYDNEIKFNAVGVGAHGMKHYNFSLDLFLPVKNDTSSDETKPQIRLFENRVEIILRKGEVSWWPRLTAQPQKPAWLKIDFDLWKSQDIDDSDTEMEKRDVMSDYPNMLSQLEKEEFGYKREDVKKVYLILYNLFQFVGFTYVMSVMAVRYSKLGPESIATTYDHVGSAMKFLHLMMWLEVLHPIFGYTKGGIFVPFMQVFGRNLILFAMIEAEPRMQTKPVVFYLFMIWSTVELVRYPFYISQLYKTEIYFLTWLRYSIWIPLYPLGILCESVVVLRNLPYFEETGRFTISLPNTWNFTFHMPTFMKVHLMLQAVPGLYFMMKHMYQNRKSKLKDKVVIKKIK